MSEFSFDNRERMGKIIPKPQDDSHATLLPSVDGLWESTYTLLSLPSSGNMTVACFNGSDSEELIISVIAGMYVCQYINMLVVITCDTDIIIVIYHTLNILKSVLLYKRYLQFQTS